MSTQTQEKAKIEQLKHENPDEMEHAAGREREHLQGWVPELATEAEIGDALEKAFDYRGDITITKKDGVTVEGYLYDRNMGKGLADSFVKLLPSSGPVGGSMGARKKITIAYAEIARLEFSGKDTAEGKRFEDWVKQYREKKAAGEKNIQIVPEKLD
jgi:hypothetical protein